MNRISRPLLMAIGAIVVTVVIATIAAEAYRYFDGRAIARDVERVRATAQQFAGTPAEARSWLEENGYDVVIWNPYHESGFVGLQQSAEREHLIVKGQRQLREGDWFIRPTWLTITFAFLLDSSFRSVEVETWPLELVGGTDDLGRGGDE